MNRRKLRATHPTADNKSPFANMEVIILLGTNGYLLPTTKQVFHPNDATALFVRGSSIH